METQLYKSPVNYRDGEGDWKPIEGGLEYEGRPLTNGANSFDLSLPVKMGQERSASPEAGQWVSYKLLGEETHPAQFEEGDVARYQAPSGPDFDRSTLANGVKEEIELPNPSAPNSFRFELEASSVLTPQIEADGLLAFRGGEGEVFAALPRRCKTAPSKPSRTPNILQDFSGRATQAIETGRLFPVMISASTAHRATWTRSPGKDRTGSSSGRAKHRSSSKSIRPTVGTTVKARVASTARSPSLPSLRLTYEEFKKHQAKQRKKGERKAPQSKGKCKSKGQGRDKSAARKGKVSPMARARQEQRARAEEVSSFPSGLIEHDSRLDILCCFEDDKPLIVTAFSARTGESPEATPYHLKPLLSHGVGRKTGEQDDGEPLYESRLGDQPVGSRCGRGAPRWQGLRGQ